MSDFNKVVDARYGRMAFNQNDRYVGRSFDLYGEFSQGEVDVFQAIVSPGDFVVDAGANIGAHTLFFAKQGCTVLAFEPQRMVHQLLCANMALNSVTSAYCYNIALADREGDLLVPELNPEEVMNWGGLSIEGYSNGYAVAVETVDSFMLPACRLIKIDVEGMEEKVLRGAKATIEEYKPVLYVENDRAEKSDSLLKYIESLGYVMRTHNPLLFNPDNFAGNSYDVFQNIASMNLICVHKSDERTIVQIESVIGE